MSTEEQSAMRRRISRTRSTLPPLDRIIEAMSEAVLAIDRSGRVVAANPAAVALLDLPDRAAALRPIDEYDRVIVEWKVGEEVFAPHELRRALSGQTISREKATITTAAGRQRIVEFTVAPIRDEQGQVVMAMMVATDVTRAEPLRAYWETVATAARDLTTSMDIGRVLESVLDQMVEVLGAQVVIGVWRMAEGGQSITLMASRGLSEETAAKIGTLPLECESFLCEAARTRETRSREDVRLEPLPHSLDRWIVEAEGLVTWLSAPLVSGDRLVGVIAYGSRAPRLLVSEEMEAVGVVNRLFAAALDHALLYEASESTRREAEEVRDVNRRLLDAARRGQEQAERQASELEAIIGSIASGVVIYDSEGRIVRMNPAAEQILGYSAAERELQQAGWAALLRAETAEGKPLPLEESPLSKALRGETVREATVVVDLPEGRERRLSCTAAPIRMSDGAVPGAVIAFTDVTEQYERQRQREEYLSLISHDLRAPLTPVLGQAQLLHRSLSNRGMTREANSASAIARNAQRMNAMIQDLVEVGRLEAGLFAPRVVPVRLDEMARDLLDRVGTAEDRSRLQIETAGEVPPVDADPDRIERVIVNLITNELKYSTPGTPVLIRVGRADDEVLVSITDRGPGIPSEDLPRLFQRHYRAQAGKESEGLGLGLYISRMIVESHGGRIRAESEVGEGSTFSFALPVAPRSRRGGAFGAVPRTHLRSFRRRQPQGKPVGLKRRSPTG